MSDDKTIYFAAKDATSTAGILLEKASSFYNYMTKNAYLDKLRQSWKAYHGIYLDDPTGNAHTVVFTGEQGELVHLPVNHYRNIAQHIYVMITSNRPMMEARAVNTDYKSLAQTYLANGILDYYMREKKLEDVLKRAAEMAVVLGSGYIKLEWNATAGDIYEIDEETGHPIYEGEAEFSNLSPFDIVVDGTKDCWNNEWILTRSFKNRFNLMAKYPEFTEQLRGIESKHDTTAYRVAFYSNDDTDDIPVYEFYHKPTEALPKGRYMFFASEDTVFLDTEMPYRTIPIFRIAPGEILGTPYGYTPMFDIMPIQEGINSLMSTILTNQNAFGVQNLYVPRGADIAINQLEGGLNVIEGNIKPEALNLTQTPAEVFKFVEMLIQTAETLSAVNSVTRGNPEASLNSGTALALVQSMSLQFVSGLQQSYVRLLEDVGTCLINILKDYANAPKVIALVGKNNRPLLKEFNGESIANINRVIVDVGNPLSRTIAGRVQMAEQLLQMQAIKDPSQYFQVINTGRLDVMFEGDMSELLLIKRENEDMLEGKHVLTTMLDQHKTHIIEHKNVLNDPDLRNDPDLVSNVLEHIQEHINYLRTADPELLSLINEQPLGQGAGGGQPQQMNEPEQNAPGDIMQVQQPSNPGEMVGGPINGQTLPQVPSPPPPFENQPVLASDLAPPIGG